MNLDDILDETENIDQLSKDAVKDVWTRKKLWEVHRNRIMNIHQGMDESTDLQQVINQLKPGSPDGTVHDFIRNYEGIQTISNSNKQGVSPEEYVWRQFTNSDTDEADLVRLAREDIKTSVNGGCGMPVHEIIRDGIRSWLELENE